MKDSIASLVSTLMGQAESLVETIRSRGDAPPERTRRRVHRLRRTLGRALILSEMLARETGNDPMVEMNRRPDGTREARFALNLEEVDLGS